MHTGGVGHQRCRAQTPAAIALSRGGHGTGSCTESDPHAGAVTRQGKGERLEMEVCVNTLPTPIESFPFPFPFPLVAKGIM